jgi:hypothetical protein
MKLGAFTERIVEHFLDLADEVAEARNRAARQVKVEARAGLGRLLTAVGDELVKKGEEIIRRLDADLTRASHVYEKPTLTQICGIKINTIGPVANLYCRKPPHHKGRCSYFVFSR